jgi:hypothetical protein
MARRKKIIVKLIVISVFIFAFFYGFHPFERSLYGVYVSNQNVTDSIFIYKNYHYIHKVVVRDSLKTNEGRWTYSYGTIRFYDFKSYAGDLPIDSGTRITNVNISYKGIIEIEINSDSNINYLKVK